MKKILLLTTPLGEEEDVAARNLREALEHLAPDDVRVEVPDLLDSCYGRFDSLLTLPFLAGRKWKRGLMSADAEGLRDSLRDVLRALQPDVVVSTSSLYGILIDEIYRGGRSRDFSFIALAVDDDPAWAQVTADFFAVASETAAQDLAEAGVPKKKIRIFGYPVQFSLAEDKHETAQSDRPRILYLINSARKKAPKLLGRLQEESAWDVTVCIDGDPDLEEIARARTDSGHLDVIGHLRNLPQLLRQHDVVISRASTAIVQEAIAARCPLITPKIGSSREETNLILLKQANAGVLAEKPREVIDWLERAFRDNGKLLGLWRMNLAPLGRPDATLNLARFVLEEASQPADGPALRALPTPAKLLRPRLRRLPKRLLLCDFHTHTTWSDGKLTVPEMVDFYGQRGFDCLCITDHLCDPKRLLGKLVNLTGLVIPPDELSNYFEAIEREKKRAWAKYDLMLMTGVEFNKDGYTAKTSTHLLGVDLKQPIDASLEIKELIREIHAQGGLAIASHPHEMKSHWGRDTLYLWEHVDEFAPLLDAWEVANRDDIFNPVGLKKLPFIASSDFHKPKHIHSWKTLLYCEKEAEAIKHCIRVNRDVSLTLYRDLRFGLEEHRLPALADAPLLAEKRG